MAHDAGQLASSVDPVMIMPDTEATESTDERPRG